MPVRLLCYGASISEVGRTPNYFGGASRAEMNWGQQLSRLLNEKYPHTSFTTLHYGIGGQNAYELLGRFDWTPPDIDLLMIQVGTNDCGYHEIPPQATANAVRSLIEATRVLRQADVMMVGSAGDNPCSPVLVHVSETLQAMRAVARENAVPIVPLREAVLVATDNGKRWAEYHDGEQGVHPNDRGMAVWASAVFQTIIETLSNPSPGTPIEHYAKD